MRTWNIPSQAQQVAAGATGLGKNPTAGTGAPIALTAELGAVAAGSGAVFPTIGLQPGFRTAYWIDEVRITVGNIRQNAQSGLPVALRLLFQTGAYKVSKFPIPSMMFSQIYGYDEYDFGPERAVTLNRLEYTNFRWLLPKPLYMPAGDILQCSVERDATFASAFTMQNTMLSYLGRACAPGDAPPAVRNIPWVTYYKHPGASAYSETNDEFRNPFLKPLMVQRLIARYGRLASFPQPDQLISAFSAQNSLPSAIVPTLRFPNVKILDSLGYMIVPTMTPLGAVIDPLRAAWTFNRALSPREQLAIAFQTVGSDIPADTFLSMVGYREENV